jgi:phosphoribosylaminoimidazole-succinocarboxamide synthase
MSRRRQIYEGKAKILYEGPEPGTIIQYFKDDATAFNAQKTASASTSSRASPTSASRRISSAA